MDGTQKKTILYIITKSNWGGAQRYVYDLACEARRRGYTPIAAVGGDGLLTARLEQQQIPVYRLDALGRDIHALKDLWAFFEIIRVIRREKPDIVHVNSAKAGGIGGLAARLAGVKKIIFTAHGWPFLEQRSGIARAVLCFFSWLTVLLSHHTICVSDADLQIAWRMPWIGSKASGIHNGIASGMTQNNFLPRQERRRVRVLTNAELNSNKNLFAGIDAVIAARARGDDITYDIMGDGELRSELAEYIARKNATGFISLLGFVPDGSMQYNQYDIFFLPSKKEGLPYVLLEAGMAGLPVVASNVGGIPEIIEDGTSGILSSPFDTDGFAEALAILADNAVFRARLGSALKKHVEKNFSLQTMLDKTFALYRPSAEIALPVC